MNTDFDFRSLYVCDLANNHQGDLGHGVRVVQEVGRVAASQQVRVALKLQFRQLETFVHPSHREESDNKHIPRFLSTALGDNEFASLVDESRKAGLVTMCTPFDEASVDRINELGIEVVKVASCSANDWPLLEKITAYNRPVIVSMGGLDWKQIDDLVSFFDHRRVHYALMHCVSLYPTPRDQLELNQIDRMCRRYPDKVIGFSTHEDPSDLTPVQVAVAKGAQILERHVGLVTADIQLNAYSSTPEQLEAWIEAAEQAREASGADVKPAALASEVEALNSLKRGVFAKTAIAAGTGIEREMVYFAMPCESGQLLSEEWSPGIVARERIEREGPLSISCLQCPDPPEKQVLITCVHTIKGMLHEAGIALNTEFEIEFSHHYGVAEFPRLGSVIINCVNRSYCKKLIVVLPGQTHPMHYHKKKEETFQLLSGVLELEVDGRQRVLNPGDVQLVQQGVWHSFRSETGAIFEEISSTHFNDDSFYEDKAINQVERSARKTVVNQWGSHQLS